MPYNLIWIAKALKDAGLNVVEEKSWKNHGRGATGKIRGVLCHDTAGPEEGNSPSLNVVKNGRSDLKGPLSQIFLARDGTLHVVAAGRCNHAGKGNWHGIKNGNYQMIGIEAENTGLDNDMPWPEVQYDAYVKCVAALLNYLGLTEKECSGHKEYCLPHGRKIDPSFDMDEFRVKVAPLIKTKEK